MRNGEKILRPSPMEGANETHPAAGVPSRVVFVWLCHSLPVSMVLASVRSLACCAGGGHWSGVCSLARPLAHCAARRAALGRGVRLESSVPPLARSPPSRCLSRQTPPPLLAPIALSGCDSDALRTQVMLATWVGHLDALFLIFLYRCRKCFFNCKKQKRLACALFLIFEFEYLC